MGRQAEAPVQQQEAPPSPSPRNPPLHIIKEEDERRSTSSSNPGWVSLSVAEGGTNPESNSDDPTPSSDVAAAAASVAAASPRSLDDAPVSVNAVDFGLKVANEIMGLHTQAAAAGRALAYSNRQMELLQEESRALKEELSNTQQSQKGLEQELSRLKAKVDQRGMELLLQQQKLHAAQQRCEGQARKTAEQEAATAAACEKYDALVMRLMVVVARAAVAAEELDKAVKADKGTPDSSSHLKPALQHTQEVLVALASFRDTWLPDATPETPTPFERAKAAAVATATGKRATPAMQATIASSSSMSGSGGYQVGAGWQSQLPVSARAPRAVTGDLLEPPEDRPNVRVVTSSKGSSNRRHSMGCTLTASRASCSYTGSTTQRQSVARAAVVPPLQLSSLQQHQQQHQHQQQLERLQQQLDHLRRLQEQRQARKASCSPAPKRAPRSYSAGSSQTASPREAFSSACMPSTATLGAAASLVYGSILQQKRHLRPSRGAASSFNGSRLSARERSTTSYIPAELGNLPWNSSRTAAGAHKAGSISTSLGPSRSPSAHSYYPDEVEAAVAAYDPEEHFRASTQPPLSAYASGMDLQQYQRSTQGYESSSSFSGGFKQQALRPGRRAASVNGF